MYHGTHPVYVSHSKELEPMLYFLASLQERRQKAGKDSGKEYECLIQTRKKCAELLMMLYAEDSDIILLDDIDYQWIRKLITFAQDNGIVERYSQAG